MKKGEILYCGKYTGFAGGIERYAFQTALCLRSAGWQVHWCGRESARGETQFRTGFDQVYSPDDPPALKECRLVLLHKLPELAFLERLRRQYGSKVVFLVHDHDLYCPRHHYYTPFGRVNCHRPYDPVRCGICSHIASPGNWPDADTGARIRALRGGHCAVLSRFMKENLLRNGFEEEKIHILPPVIDLREKDSAGEEPDGGELRILYLGQLIRGKGVDLLLRALSSLKIPWRATAAGDGNDRAMLEELAGRLGIADRVRFTGWQEDTDPCFARCDVAVFPSRWQEPFGLSGAEALGHGVPVVAFDTGGVREWLEDGETGFIVPEQDTAGMALRLETLYREPALRKRMGSLGKTRIRERFSQERFFDALERLMETVNS